MNVEIWTDIVCPWCGIGDHRLTQAVARFEAEGGEPVDVVHRSFQLDARAGAPRPVRELLREKYGMDDARLAAMTRQVEGIAAADGLVPYVSGDNVIGNTGLVHQMLQMANSKGLGDTAWAMASRAYFGEQRSIFDVESVVALGAQIGLDAAELREALASGRYAAAVDADCREAAALGCTGVPFVVINRKVGVAGAQSVDTLVRALRSV
jgi:predicted DsbA family dithiol-disulfide isomerase